MNLMNWEVEIVARVAFHTLGCKVNQYETEAMIDLFKKANYKIVNFQNPADLYIINSCTVTNQAASKSRKKARRAKRRNADAKVIMVGCYPQAFPDEVDEVEEIDHFIGAEGKKDIVNLVEETIKEEDYDFLNEIKRYEDITLYEELRVDDVRQTTRANVKIEDGCNQFCSYCIIPYARGPVRSRKKESVLSEIKSLVDNGIREIILTGTHLGNYGLDNDEPGALSKLVEEITRLDGEFRLRLSSIEVTEIDDRLIDLLEQQEKLCPHLHIPLQSGSDDILEKMRRPYNQDDFRIMIKKLRKRIPELAITTDVIVGFPGETEENFRETYDFIKEMEFSRLHVFPFSVREGTPASNMSNRVHGDTKNKRSKKLRNLNKKLMLKYQQRFINEVRSVVIEENRDHETDMLSGVTDNYIRVLIDGLDKYREQMVEVKLLEKYDYENVLAKIIDV